MGRGMTFVAYKNLRYFLITHRLQKLVMSLKIFEHMTWHYSHDANDEVMMHPFDGEAWKQFNRVHLQFSMEPWNVHLGLSTDEFNQFGSFVAPYSCWPVILTIFLFKCHWYDTDRRIRIDPHHGLVERCVWKRGPSRVSKKINFFC
jgi:hypothetical protein